MVSDFGITKYCKECGLEVIREGDCVTFSEDSKFCECYKGKCIICGGIILNRKTKDAKTCNQHCAGKLAWKTIGDKNGFE